jgi:uncharacterized repeat protein (TIGR03803 family)
MRPTKSRLFRTTFCSLVAVAWILAPPACGAPRYKVLHAFGAGTDGGGLYSGLAFDSKGNLFGTTSGGGNYGYGTVYELTPHANGKWTEKLLRSFRNNDPDGDEPQGGLIFDPAGIFYGTTCCGGGRGTYGTVFKLEPRPNGTWVETVLHRFGPHDEAGAPNASLVMDEAGNLFGGAGPVYELSPNSRGWKETILHKFPAFKGDGLGASAVILDPSRKIYGTSEYGGSQVCPLGCGTVYELERLASGKWKEHILHTFAAFPHDGETPIGALVMDKAGNLYGTAGQGGAYTCFVGCGTVFKVSRGADGRWKETILYDFRDGASGNGPAAGSVRDGKGNLYGTTIYGGSPQCGCGVVYKLSPTASGKWKYTVLHTFTGNDGAQPEANLIFDRKGNLYGTTVTGGAGGAGVAFELTP